MGVVVVGYSGVGDGDAGVDLLIEELLLGEAAADVALELVEGEIVGLEFGLELILGIGSLGFGDLGVNLGIGSGQAFFSGALIDFGFEDEVVQDVELERILLVKRGGRLLWGIRGQLHVVGFVDIGLEDGMAVDGGHDALLRALVAAGEEKERGRKEDTNRRNRLNTDRANRHRHRGGFLTLRGGVRSHISL